VRRRRCARHRPPWRPAAESPAACVVDLRFFYRTRRRVPVFRPGLQNRADHRVEVAPPPSRTSSWRGPRLVLPTAVDLLSRPSGDHATGPKRSPASLGRRLSGLVLCAYPVDIAPLTSDHRDGG
jgi:hypothetical protein